MLVVGRLPFYKQTGESISHKSIAVLPFENLSEDKANAYFATGIQDEILTRLAKIGALKVISRNSTQQYAARPAICPRSLSNLLWQTLLKEASKRLATKFTLTCSLFAR
jgi:TolB-like protein